MAKATLKGNLKCSLSRAKKVNAACEKKWLTHVHRLDTTPHVTYLKDVANQFRWQVGAACKGVPSYIFFPEERAFEGFKENPLFLGKKAKDYCDNCPVRAICLEFSVLHDTEGIWGNTTDGQRSKRYPRGERFELRDDLEELGKYEALYGHS